MRDNAWTAEDRAWSRADSAWQRATFKYEDLHDAGADAAPRVAARPTEAALGATIALAQYAPDAPLPPRARARAAAPKDPQRGPRRPALRAIDNRL